MTGTPTAEAASKPEIAKASFADFFQVTDATDPARVAALNGYLEAFCQPVYDGTGLKCPHCGGYVTGFMALIGGGFVWGITHGEGMCGHCRMPARGKHRFHDDATGVKFEGGAVLFYHPSVLVERESSETVADG